MTGSDTTDMVGVSKLMHAFRPLNASRKTFLAWKVEGKPPDVEKKRPRPSANRRKRSSKLSITRTTTSIPWARRP